jgi:hypothetical protein
MNHRQVQDFSIDDANFEFQDNLFYRDGILYVFYGFVRFQVFQSRHNDLAISHFGFNKAMELMFQNYWWPQLWKYVKEFVGSCNLFVLV